MAKASARLDAARKAYREALESARAKPTPEAWTRLLAAGKELSSAEESRPRSRRGRRPSAPESIEPSADAEVVPEPAGQAAGEVDADPS
ncbi:MAG TPA: hypothetical protein VF841_19545 [Anaeromyxobacter sp.]